MKKFTFYKQLNSKDCGPTCLRMISKYYGKLHDAAQLRLDAGYTRQGVNLLGISNAAENIGFRTRGIQMTLSELLNNCPLPCILHWNQNHFVVLIGQKRNGRITIADPAENIIDLTIAEFSKHWISQTKDNTKNLGTALLLEPTPEFYQKKESLSSNLNWTRISQYLKNSKKQIAQVALTTIITSTFQFIIPFLTQNIVDKGINSKNLSFISVFLFAQLALTLSRTIIEFIRSRLIMQISINLNYSLVSDFWKKVTSLPISFFDSFHTGDTLQRLRDSKKIETFLTGTAPNTIFSVFSFITFIIVLLSYSYILSMVFLIGSIIYVIWIRLFLRLRRRINYESFHLSAKEYNVSLQLVQGIQELKLNNAENLKRWEWENIQRSLYKVQSRILSYTQKQQAGALLIKEGKNLFLTFLAAQMVIEGQITFGAMLAVQYIIGQLNNPIEYFISFTQNGQDAKISLERLNEIHNLDNEEVIEPGTRNESSSLPKDNSILFENINFRYPGSGNDLVLKNINIKIEGGKTTAIVGNSGSGKTTLLKLLLKCYEGYEGNIIVGNKTESNCQINLKKISPSFWRSQCGSVLQDGFIFNDSIAQNIAIGDETPDSILLTKASKIANIDNFILSLPNGFSTNIGATGVGISQGQRQRLLIARAVYKDPRYLFFDEATNSLDANTEKAIVQNLQEFCNGRTVVVVAHRLSTVKNANKIIVLSEGKVAEEGTHTELIQQKGMYLELIKNQLELDS